MDIATCQEMAGNIMLQLENYPRTQGEKSDSESGSEKNLCNAIVLEQEFENTAWLLTVNVAFQQFWDSFKTSFRKLFESQ
jgi:hypothetical protein